MERECSRYGMDRNGWKRRCAARMCWPGRSLAGTGGKLLVGLAALGIFIWLGISARACAHRGQSGVDGHPERGHAGVAAGLWRAAVAADAVLLAVIRGAGTFA